MAEQKTSKRSGRAARARDTSSVNKPERDREPEWPLRPARPESFVPGDAHAGGPLVTVTRRVTSEESGKALQELRENVSCLIGCDAVKLQVLAETHGIDEGSLEPLAELYAFGPRGTAEAFAEHIEAAALAFADQTSECAARDTEIEPGVPTSQRPAAGWCEVVLDDDCERLSELKIMRDYEEVRAFHGGVDRGEIQFAVFSDGGPDTSCSQTVLRHGFVGPRGSFERVNRALADFVRDLARTPAATELEAADPETESDLIDGFLNRLAADLSDERKAMMRAELARMFGAVEIPEREPERVELLRGIVDGLADAELSFVNAIAGSVEAHGDDEPAARAG